MTTKTSKCGTCGNVILDGEAVTRVENKSRPNSVLTFHADYVGCSEAEQRQGAAYARKHGETRRKACMTNVNIGLEGVRG